METLTEIGRRNFTEKANLGFLDIYEELWKYKFHRDSELILLEIGVYNGNSMRTWCEWFSQATIIGIDKFLNPRDTDHCGKVLRGDQSDIEFLLKEVTKHYPWFDIIIDDGSHEWEHQQISFEALWPHVLPGGMYIIEDLQTSADDFWGDGAKVNTVEYLTNIAKDLVYGNEDIYSITFYERIAVLIKGV